MERSTTIIQEFYKVREIWEEIAANMDWRIAIWLAKYEDVQLIDTFLETERSSIGIFADIFFRFETEFTGDSLSYEKALWREYFDWFTENEKSDILPLLEEEELLENYIPQETDTPTLEHLFTEILRFKSCLKDGVDRHFCLYFPPTLPSDSSLTGWYEYVLSVGVPEGLRIITIDYIQQKKIDLRPSSLIVNIEPELNTLAAIENEISKGCDAGDTVNPEQRFKQQIIKTLKLAAEKKEDEVSKECVHLISIASETESPLLKVTAQIISAQAFYILNNTKKSLVYSEKALMDGRELMDSGDNSGFPIWKSALLLKGSILIKEKRRKEAIELYEELAVMAAQQGDAFSVMEGYRLSGYMYFELNEKKSAFERTLLALAGGAFLDKNMRRKSTFVYAATLALKLGNEIKSPNDVKILEKQFQEWLGDDWRDLLNSKEMENATLRRKASLFNR